MTRVLEGYSADLALADQIAAILKIDPRRVLYQLRYGEPFMKSLAKANRNQRRRRRELTDEEAARIAAADRDRDADDYDRGRVELRSVRKDSTMPTNIYSFAKRIVRDGPAGIDESGFTAAVTEAAKRLYPSLTPEAAFTRAFTESELLKRAYSVVKAGRPPTD